MLITRPYSPLKAHPTHPARSHPTPRTASAPAPAPQPSQDFTEKEIEAIRNYQAYLQHHRTPREHRPPDKLTVAFDTAMTNYVDAFIKSGSWDEDLSLALIDLIQSIPPGSAQEPRLVELLNGSKLLLLAVMKRDRHLSSVILDRPVNPNITTPGGATPLHLAGRTGQHKTFMKLLKKGADLSATAVNGRTPFHEAARGGNLDILKQCTVRGVDWDKADKKGAKATHLAFSTGRAEALDYLFELGCDRTPFKRNSYYIVTAVNADNVALARIMLKAGANPRARDKVGDSILTIAREIGNPRMINLLKRYMRH